MLCPAISKHCLAGQDRAAAATWHPGRQRSHIAGLHSCSRDENRGQTPCHVNQPSPSDQCCGSRPGGYREGPVGTHKVYRKQVKWTVCMNIFVTVAWQHLWAKSKPQPWGMEASGPFLLLFKFLILPEMSFQAVGISFTSSHTRAVKAQGMPPIWVPVSVGCSQAVFTSKLQNANPNQGSVVLTVRNKCCHAELAAFRVERVHLQFYRLETQSEEPI